MRASLRRWMTELVVIHALPEAAARQFADPALLEWDQALAVLRAPEAHGDGEVFSALCFFDGKRLAQSPVCRQSAEKSARLFSQVWRLALRQSREGGALSLVLDRWISAMQSEAMRETGLSANDPALAVATDRKIFAVTASVSELVHGFEFGRLLSAYYRAYVDGEDDMKGRVLRWFRGEYVTKSEAKEALGVSIIITDDDWYDYLKLFAAFFRLAGYQGMMIMVDELVNLYKIPNSVTRQYNYEKLLTMYNDTLQGKAKYLGILMGATPQALEDKRRGIYSYEALRSRLAEGRFSKPGVRDLLAPVIRLDPLTAEEMLVLCEKLADMHAGLYGYDRKIDTGDLAAFIQTEYSRIGADEHITPREVIRDFIELLDLLYQHPEQTIAGLLRSEDFAFAKSQAVSDQAEAGFAEFTL
ncbi:MAG: ATP-binding protein [Clostridia bacterium]|nr:ATP-binding protein [Clostridia bacterium]